MKKFIEEFKEFVLRGNVLNLAVGMIIGAAFTAIVNSLVEDIISPLVGFFSTDGFSGLTLNVGTLSLHYGAFVMAIVNFLITALVVFIFIKAVNKMMNLNKKDEKEAEPTTKVCPYCKSEISIDATRCPNCTSKLERFEE